MYSAYRYSGGQRNGNESNKESPSNFSLSLINSNVGQENEGILRNFLAKKLLRNILFSDAGHISTVKFPKSDGSEVDLAIYYIRLSGEVESRDEAGDGNDDVAPDFIVCLLDQDKNKLDLFHSELDAYANETIQSLLSENASSLESVCPDWHKVCIDYLPRSVQLLGDSLSDFISSAVKGEAIKFEGFESDCLKDLEMFLESLRVVEQFTFESEQPHGRKTSLVSQQEGRIVVTRGNPESGCSELVENLKNLSQSGQAVQMKQTLYAFRLKVSQELNSLRRLIGQAESDYYALYRLYGFLSGSGHASLLLDHLSAWELNQPEEKEVVDIIREFMARPHVHPLDNADSALK